MSKKDELLKEVDLALEKIYEFCVAKIGKYSEKDLENESHLMGIDVVHDACHTLRGRLPKTNKVDLKAMKDSWKKD